jgi:hypothetical protein
MLDSRRRTVGRRSVLAAGVTLAAWSLLPQVRPGPALAAGPPKRATLYKSPFCGCCEEHAGYLRTHGFEVTVVPTGDLALVRRHHRVPDALAGCHTILIDGYVVEGHVPAGAIDKLLRERPPIIGISLPGMPEGSPGMSGAKSAPFVIYRISDGSPAVFVVE